MTIDKKHEINSIKPVVKILKNSENRTIALDAISSNVVSDIPVLIGKIIIDLHINHLVKLPETANNINCIKNKIILKSCKFLQGSNVLFLKGTILKKIYYTSATHENLRFHQLNIPFESTTTVTFNKSQNFFTFHNMENFNEKTIEFFNNRPFCELISSKITEHCKYITKKDNNYNMKTSNIDEFIELDTNMTIKLKFQILQNQQVKIKPHSTNSQESSWDNHKSSLENKADMKDISNLNDKTGIETKPTLDNLYNDFSDSNKFDLIDDSHLENKSNLNYKHDIEAKPTLDSLNNKFNYNDKLDLDYLLNFYNGPYDELDLIDNMKFQNKDNIKNKPTLNYLFNEFNYNDKLDLNYLLDFYSSPDDDTKFNNSSSLFDKYNLQNKYNLYNKTNINHRNDFNNYNARNNTSSIHRHISYRSLILFLCLFILFNNNDKNTFP